MVEADVVAEIEAALLCISEARERADRLARRLRRAESDPALVEALAAAEQQLSALHSELMRRTYFGAAEAAEKQLKLAG